MFGIAKKKKKKKSFISPVISSATPLHPTPCALLSSLCGWVESLISLLADRALSSALTLWW